MAFRKPKSDQFQILRQWQAWLDTHRSTLRSIGLPPEVYLDQERWDDFLENGHLHRHAGTGFEFDKDFDRQQLECLREFLEQQSESQPTPPLLAWLRVRQGASENS